MGGAIKAEGRRREASRIPIDRSTNALWDAIEIVGVYTAAARVARSESDKDTSNTKEGTATLKQMGQVVLCSSLCNVSFCVQLLANCWLKKSEWEFASRV